MHSGFISFHHKCGVEWTCEHLSVHRFVVLIMLNAFTFNSLKNNEEISSMYGSTHNCSFVQLITQTIEDNPLTIVEYKLSKTITQTEY